MASWPLIRDQWLVLIKNNKTESQNELAFNKQYNNGFTATLPKFHCSSREISFQAMPDSLYMKAILSIISLWTRILKMLQGALLLFAHVVKGGRPWALYVGNAPDGSSASCLRPSWSYASALWMYGVLGNNHCVPRRTDHCRNYFICWYSDAASSSECVLAIPLP